MIPTPPPPVFVIERADALGVRLGREDGALLVEESRRLPAAEWEGLCRDLAAVKAEVLAELRWRELSAERPGGIVIDRPDPERRRVALEAIAGEPGDVTGEVHPRHLAKGAPAHA
jgi:hypothetical protein